MVRSPTPRTTARGGSVLGTSRGESSVTDWFPPRRGGTGNQFREPPGNQLEPREPPPCERWSAPVSGCAQVRELRSLRPPGTARELSHASLRRLKRPRTPPVGSGFVLHSGRTGRPCPAGTGEARNRLQADTQTVKARARFGRSEREGRTARRFHGPTRPLRRFQRGRLPVCRPLLVG
jgi:hypothetical protein